MKNLVFNFKLFLFRILKITSFIISFYFSVIFFIMLFADEALRGIPNHNLSQEFTLIISKINALPERLFDANEREQVDLSRLF